MWRRILVRCVGVLFHMKRSSNEGEAVEVACSLCQCEQRSAGDIASFVADLNVLQVQDTLLLSDSLVLSRNLLSRGLPLIERCLAAAAAWLRVVSCRAILTDDAKRVAALPLIRATDGSDGGGWGGAVYALRLG